MQTSIYVCQKLCDGRFLPLFLIFFLLLFFLSHHLCQLQRHCPRVAHPDIPTPSLIHSTALTSEVYRRKRQTVVRLFITALTPEVYRRKRQIAGMLPSENYTALRPSHFGRVSDDRGGVATHLGTYT